jgi:hypothetical protein
MDNLTLQMLADNIEPTDQNKELYLKQILVQVEEPTVDYDLVIPYEKLFYDTAWIERKIKQTFGIDITTPWLETYRRDYEAYHQPA